MDKSEMKKPFSVFKLMREDFRTMMNGWREGKAERKLAQKRLENRLITKETYERLVKQDGEAYTVELNKVLNRYNAIANAFLEYAIHITGTPKERIQFAGVVMNIDLSFTTREMSWEGSITKNKPYTIFINPGTAMYLEYISTLYCILAGKIPNLNILLDYQDEVRRTFIYNTENTYSDKRPLHQKLANPYRSETVSSKYRAWTAELHPFQGKLALQFIDLLNVFLVGHEFGHLLVRESNFQGSFINRYYEIVYKYCHENDIQIRDTWAEEFVCDLISLNLSLYYLDDNPISDTIDAAKEGKGFINLHALQTSRGNVFNNLLQKDIQAQEDAKFDLARIDEKCGLLNAVKIFFWSLSDISDEAGKTHPKISARLDLILWYWKNMMNMPPIMQQMGNGCDLLRENLKARRSINDLTHPLFNR